MLLASWQIAVRYIRITNKCMLRHRITAISAKSLFNSFVRLSAMMNRAIEWMNKFEVEWQIQNSGELSIGANGFHIANTFITRFFTQRFNVTWPGILLIRMRLYCAIFEYQIKSINLLYFELHEHATKLVTILMNLKYCLIHAILNQRSINSCLLYPLTAKNIAFSWDNRR